ncbi:hypothetical protein DIPPA_11539 [Diplonema papillatum]|nr:hypothetical protein DIPPA_11539 [Diplonema papillatum]
MTTRRRAKAAPAPVIEKLAQPIDRPEVVCTPGPTVYDVKTPFADRKIHLSWHQQSGRSLPLQPGSKPSAADRMSDPDSTAYKYVQPKSFAATFASGPRWPAGSKQPEASSGPIDTGDAWRACQPKSQCAQFNLATATKAFPRDPLLLRGTLGPAPGYYSSDWHTLTKAVQRNAGGAISKEPRGTQWAVHQESPGPVYNPNYRQVECVCVGGAFSKFPRFHGLPGERTKAAGNPGPLTYADAAEKALRVLSTQKRSPSPVFSTRPGASEMPFPFDERNICNSASMRTRLTGPAGQQARADEERDRLRKQAYWGRKFRSFRRKKDAPAPEAVALPSGGPGAGADTGAAAGARAGAGKPAASAAPPQARPSTAPCPATKSQRLVKLIETQPLRQILAMAETGYAVGTWKLALPTPERATAPTSAAKAGSGDRRR